MALASVIVEERVKKDSSYANGEYDCGMKTAACLLLCGIFVWASEPVQLVFEKAAKSLAASDYTSAEQGFQAVLREEPRNVAAISNLGTIYSRTNRADRAIAAYQRALKLSPDDKALLLNLGLVYLKQESHQRAMPYFARVVAIDPAHQQARQLLAICRLYTGELKPAIRELELSRAANPRDEQVLFLLGFAYLKNQEPATAKGIFEQMFAVAGPARTQFMLGRACYEAALFERAEESFLEVLRLDPAFPGAHLELGKVYIGERRTVDAVRELELVLKDNPTNEDANYFLGSWLVQENRYTEALPYLDRARTLRPDSWAIYSYLGKAKLGLGQSPEAVALFQRAVELNPDEGPTFYQLGRALKVCGRNVEAERAFRRARELDLGVTNEHPRKPAR